MQMIAERQDARPQAGRGQSNWRPRRRRENMNLYAYVRGDPVNRSDPSGLQDDDCDPSRLWDERDRCIVVTGRRPTPGGPPTQFDPPGGVGSGGGTGPSEPEIVVTSNQCYAATREPGPVYFLGVAYETTLLLGWTTTHGLVYNPATGTRANFSTFGFTAGIGAGFGETTGQANSMADFVGFTDTYNFGARVPFMQYPVGWELSAGGAWSFNMDGESVSERGFSGAMGGPFPNLPSISLSGAFTETRIYNCTVGG